MARGMWVVCLSLVIYGAFGDEELHDTDWREGGKMSVAGDQASCNGCVAFAISGALEWYAANLTNHLIPLSVQYLIDCGIDEYTGDVENGCAGGAINTEVDEIMSTQYVPYAEDYVWESNFKDGRCDQYHAREKLLRNALADVWVFNYIPLSQTAHAIRKALQSGPTVHTLFTSEEAQSWNGDKVQNDKGCASNPLPHAMTFVGWQQNNGNPYFIARNSYGEKYGKHGYVKYADSEINLSCAFQNNAYSILVGKRHELEYSLGEGIKTFVGARQWCQTQGSGWDLAHIPTQMHNLEVFDLFTQQFGDEKKKDDIYNYFWIGLSMPSDKWVWVSGDAEAELRDITGTEAKYLRFKNDVSTAKFTVMDKVNHGEHRIRGTWTRKPKAQTYRFVCSRYRSEACPRITQTAIPNAFSVTFFDGKKETLEINNGTKAKVCCMHGFKLKGKPAQCKGGKWKKMPACKPVKGSKDKTEKNKEFILPTGDGCQLETIAKGVGTKK